MASTLGTGSRPLRIAIVGAGPSGLYAAGALLQQKEYHVSIDIFDRLPTPYGLVRYGVAPDHQKIKSVTKIYERTLSDARVRYFGNVALGSDISRAEMKAHYDQIIYAVGAQSDRKLEIPGEDLPGSFSATEFVAWYNGHPDFLDYEVDLSAESVVVIGVGNVAMDVTRILAKSIRELETTDIADYALEKLRHSKVKHIHILARRGPVQAKFTNPEIKELGELEIADVIVKPEDLELDAASQAELAADKTAQRNLETLQEFAHRPLSGKPRQIHFHFLRSPVELYGEDRVTGMRMEKNLLVTKEGGYISCEGIGEYEELPAGLVFRAIGYRSVPIPDVPFYDRWGLIPNEKGRVTETHKGEIVPGEYVVGWAKRGPTGVIGTNKPDAVETVYLMLEDVPDLPPVADELARADAIVKLLRSRSVEFFDFGDWQILDQLETGRGAAQGRPRVKFTAVDEMLRLVHPQRTQEESPASVLGS
ncbi:MAG: FAD-dependent oxidoreductase [Caldilineaceae bacterium]|nr:FAD-dependent oxidoreductase [Caldilineaceae bacterium]